MDCAQARWEEVYFGMVRLLKVSSVATLFSYRDDAITSAVVIMFRHDHAQSIVDAGK